MRLTRKITTTNKMVIPIKPGMPTSSAKPVLGSVWVVVGPKVAVSLAPAAWVNKAETVAVLGSIWSISGAGVLVGWATTDVADSLSVMVGVVVGVVVGGTRVGVAAVRLFA